MAKISSNLSIAGSVSSSLSQTASALSAVPNPSTFAERTNVSKKNVSFLKRKTSY